MSLCNCKALVQFPFRNGERKGACNKNTCADLSDNVLCSARTAKRLQGSSLIKHVDLMILKLSMMKKMFRGEVAARPGVMLSM
jgi:hypothetical protein